MKVVDVAIRAKDWSAPIRNKEAIIQLLGFPFHLFLFQVDEMEIFGTHFKVEQPLFVQGVFLPFPLLKGLL